MPVPGAVAVAVGAGAAVPGRVAVAVGVGAAVPGVPGLPVVPLLSQVTVNALPSVSAEGVASEMSLADTRVRGLGCWLPIAVLSAVASVQLPVPKSESGSTVPSLGASAITSADP